MPEPASGGHNPALQTHLGVTFLQRLQRPDPVLTSKATPGAREHRAGRGQPRSAQRAGSGRSSCRCGSSACPTTASLAGRGPDAATSASPGPASMQHIRLDPARAAVRDLAHVAARDAVMNAQAARHVRQARRHRRRSALVQGRDHLPAAREVVLRCQQRRHRRFRRPDRQARLHRRRSASTRSGCCRSIPRRGATTATTSPNTATSIPTTAR